MKRKSFTLIEILVALIVLSILASLSVAAYQKTVNTNNERICAENLKVLQAAIDIYTVENDALPAALAQLTPRQIYLAYSRVAGERKKSILSIALRKIFSTEPAIADETPGQLFKRKYLAGKENVLCEPADKDCKPSCMPTCNSYNSNLNPLDSNIFDATRRRLNKNPNINAALVQDSSVTRHGKGTNTYGLGITPGGRVGKVTTPGYVQP